MIRGGHIDVAVLGAMEVSSTVTSRTGSFRQDGQGMGGAMDSFMAPSGDRHDEHVTKEASTRSCGLFAALTGKRCVHRIITDSRSSTSTTTDWSFVRRRRRERRRGACGHRSRNEVGTMSDGERPVYEQRDSGTKSWRWARSIARTGRTVSEADNIMFSTLTMNPQALHLDEAWRRNSLRSAPRQQPLHAVDARGLSVAQLTQARSSPTSLLRRRLPKPVFHGDTSTPRPSWSKSDSRQAVPDGVVTFEHTARNQHGEVVAVAKRATMVSRARVSWTPLGPALLFCPQTVRSIRQGRGGGDMVILDLEDGVNAGDRVVARRAVIDNLLDPQRTILRVNPVGSADFASTSRPSIRRRTPCHAGQDRVQCSG